MAETIPPIPYKVAMVDERGFLTEPWAKWIRQAFARMGGSVAPSNAELGQTSIDLTAIQSNIANLQITTTSQGNSITQLANEIGQGPDL